MNIRKVWIWLWTPLTPGRPHHCVGAVLTALILLALLWLL